MTPAKTCPIMSRPVLPDPAAEIRIAEVECLRERCAWWVPRRDRCAILTPAVPR